ncbi:hypothetical protein OGATHE_005684 [Ogataea polymorpha]|uniref:Uncharacterized protein n=1 Tax=Ogataea polymorpha TaxID=460523 RepID=A0A9P8NV62_9ASCO|nr:hypothetical protein OGATHE_005684 [Ogataea polymorpha]
MLIKRVLSADCPTRDLSSFTRQDVSGAASLVAVFFTASGETLPWTTSMGESFESIIDDQVGMYPPSIGAENCVEADGLPGTPLGVPRLEILCRESFQELSVRVTAGVCCSASGKARLALARLRAGPGEKADALLDASRSVAPLYALRGLDSSSSSSSSSQDVTSFS